MSRNETDAVEAEIAELSQHLTEPGERECLRCFLIRMIREFGCDGTYRWTIRWRNLRAPRARGLAGSIQQRGGRCDCEVICNVFPGCPQTEGQRCGARRCGARRCGGAVRGCPACRVGRAV